MEILNLNRPSSSLPDVSSESKALEALSLEQVGMGRVELPLAFDIKGTRWNLPAVMDVFVSLDDPSAKGIHMSRLYNLLMGGFRSEPVTPARMLKLLDELKESQKGLSASASVRAEFQWPLLRSALKSELTGWRQYPVIWQAELEEGQKKWSCGFEILYSSTCPCSTALAEQLLNESLSTQNLEAGLRLPALPHAQRSRARIWLEFAPESLVPPMESLIDLAESALGTPVQTAVKRVDEQEFARLNAENQMFCEDAARKLKAWLETENRVLDYWVEVSHEESLHAHNAVARVVKGRAKGLKVSSRF